MGWKPMGVEGDVKFGVCGDGEQDAAMGLLVLKTICVHIGVSMREKGGGGGCFWLKLTQTMSRFLGFSKYCFQQRVKNLKRLTNLQ